MSKYISYLLKKGDRELSFIKSKRFYFKALKFAKKYKLKNDYTPIYISIAAIYNMHERYNQALRALTLAQRYPSDDMSYNFILPLKLDILFHNNKFIQARQLAICSLRNNSHNMYENYLVLSEIYLALMIYHKAIIYAKKSLKIAWEEEYIEGLEMAYNNILDIYRITNDFPNAHNILEEVKYIGLLDKSAVLQFGKYNLLVTVRRYGEAKMLIPGIERMMNKLEHTDIHIFYAITLELFKITKDKESFDIYFHKFLTINTVKDNNIEKWLAYSQAGDFYRELHKNKTAIKYYQKMAYYLEQVRLSSLNRDTLDRIDFFEDKYYYLLEATLFLYTQREYSLSFYFLECSKSATLRDIQSNNTLAIQKSNDIKGYL